MNPKICLSLSRAFLGLINLLFFALGCLLFAIGLWLFLHRQSFAALLVLRAPRAAPGGPSDAGGDGVHTARRRGGRGGGVGTGADSGVPISGPPRGPPRELGRPPAAAGLLRLDGAAGLGPPRGCRLLLSAGAPRAPHGAAPRPLPHGGPTAAVPHGLRRRRVGVDRREPAHRGGGQRRPRAPGAVPGDALDVSARRGDSLGLQEFVLDRLFAACDPADTGLVPAQRVVRYLQEVTGQSGEECRLRVLHRMLDREAAGAALDLPAFLAVMRQWIALCQHDGSVAANRRRNAVPDGPDGVTGASHLRRDSWFTEESAAPPDDLGLALAEAEGLTAPAAAPLEDDGSDTDTASPSEAAILRSRAEQLAARNAKLQRDAESAEELNARLAEETAQLAAQLRCSQRALEHAKDAAADMDELRATAKALAEENGELRRQARHLEKEQRELRSRADGLWDENQRLLGEGRGLRERVGALAAETADMGVSGGAALSANEAGAHPPSRQRCLPALRLSYGTARRFSPNATRLSPRWETRTAPAPLMDAPKPSPPPVRRPSVAPRRWRRRWRSASGSCRSCGRRRRGGGGRTPRPPVPGSVSASPTYRRSRLAPRWRRRCGKWRRQRRTMVRWRRRERWGVTVRRRMSRGGTAMAMGGESASGECSDAAEVEACGERHRSVPPSRAPVPPLLRLLVLLVLLVGLVGVGLLLRGRVPWPQPGLRHRGPPPA
ncbi:protein KASH5 isoform X3 [Cuculus canorus]|uniref:protein KASH5 isoform X3 n=1 Tax=Cuculus canorus TaxID=55661 RepID=UPI0023AA5F61|nr:protein KASH5 isoform X3 [Cuculus canorus]